MTTPEKIDSLNTTNEYRERLDMKAIIFRAIWGCLEGAASSDSYALENRVLGLLNVLPTEVHKRVMGRTGEFNYETEEWKYVKFCLMNVGTPTRLLLHTGEALEIENNDYSEVNWNEVYSPRKVRDERTDYIKLWRVALDELENAGINWPKKPSYNTARFDLLIESPEPRGAHSK